ncbi:MAG: FkbM family methyltransferase [Methylovulum sp.]|nr:FkbM family methyltransferase [Methylovulum sp.]
MGFDLHRLTPSANPQVQLKKSLEVVNANIVFDIGANEGQFASELRSVGFFGELVSFEPLSSARKKLLSLAENDRKWSVHPQAAVGDQDGLIEINIAGNSVSSSVLPMLESHSDAAVGSAYVASEKVPIILLDSVAEQYLRPESNLFIKIDTQGYEWKVLDGASETLKRAKGVLCELSLVPLYEGQRLWRDVIERLEAEGFTLWAIQKGFTDPRDGRSLQVDAIFLRLD